MKKEEIAKVEEQSQLKSNEKNKRNKSFLDKENEERKTPIANRVKSNVEILCSYSENSETIDGEIESPKKRKERLEFQRKQSKENVRKVGIDIVKFRHDKDD